MAAPGRGRSRAAALGRYRPQRHPCATGYVLHEQSNATGGDPVINACRFELAFSGTEITGTVIHSVAER